MMKNEIKILHFLSVLKEIEIYGLIVQTINSQFTISSASPLPDILTLEISFFCKLAKTFNTKEFL